MQSLNLSGSPIAGKLQTIAFGMMALGVALTSLAVTMGGMQHFFAVWTLGFGYVLGITITMMFFSGLQFLIRAGWSASVRRLPELFASYVPIIIFGFIPVIVGLFSGELFPWFDPAHWKAGEMALADHQIHVVHTKDAYLNQNFFIARIVLYVAIWMLMYLFIIKGSLKQDSSNTDYSPTKRNFKIAAPFLIMYALTITFAGVDILMSLSPTWFSTMFGVYYFAGNWVSALSLIAIVMVMLHRAGHLKGFVTHEHYHDIGKLMFAFTVFWAYIAFCQYMLIWYSNIPEETEFFIHRVHGGWEILGWTSLIIHFVVPFLLLIRQDFKRKGNVLIIGGIIMLIANFLDLCWVVLPVFSSKFSMNGSEFGPALLLFGGLLFTFVRSAQKNNIVALNDPYLHESIELIS